MTATKTELIEDVMRREGWDRYTDNLLDFGGPTRWGITERTARAFGYTGDMRFLPYEKAFSIYSLMYWDKAQLDMVQQLDPKLAVYVFDFGVNSGVVRAGEYLQRLLNALNREESDYDDIQVDGVIGKATLSALSAFKAKRDTEGMKILRKAYNGIRIGFLFDITEANESQEAFTYGWFKRVVEL